MAGSLSVLLNAHAAVQAPTARALLLYCDDLQAEKMQANAVHYEEELVLWKIMSQVPRLSDRPT